MSTHPQQIGKYPIERVIGSGAMGVVYLASHPIMEIPVAIKTMTNIAVEKPQLRKRFFQEAKAAGKLQHENIVRIYDADTEDNVPYIVMEYLDGTDLAGLLEDRDDPMPMQTRLEIAYQVSRALEHAHEHDVIHRDIKPSNVCVLPDHRVKLVDFGIAKLDTSNLRTQGPLGTPEYMSPEQVRGETADARSDLFSLGVMLYELLTDRRPFSARSVHGTWTKILSEDPPPMNEMVNGEPVPDSLGDLVHRCLEKDVTERPTAKEAAKQLRQVLKSMPDPYSFETLDDEQIRDKLDHARELLDLGKHRRAEVVLRRLRGVRDTYAEEIDVLRKRISDVAEAGEAVERGRKALRQLDFEEAREAARVALEKAPRFQTAVLLRDQAQRAHDINAGLDRAREAMDAGEFEVAVSAAREVLEIDDSHALAARLLEQAEVALDRQRQLQECLTSAERASDAGEHEEALRRLEEALELDPDNEVALELEARVEDRIRADQEAARAAALLDADAGQETIRMERDPGGTPPTVVESPDTVADEVPAAAVPETLSDPSPTVRPHRRLVTWATTTTPGRATLGVAALLVLLMGFGLLGDDVPGAGAADAGLLAVDATPWARIVGIVDADGRQIEVADDAITPVSFELAPGSYTVTLEGPDGQETRDLEARVEASGTRSLLARFHRIDVDAYFESTGW